MSFEQVEASAESGQPVEGYKFVLGSLSWHFTTSGFQWEYLGATYKPFPMTRSAIADDNNGERSKLTIDTSPDHPIATHLRQFIPLGEMTLDVYRYHEGDNEFATIWSGRVMETNVQGKTRASITAAPFDSEVEEPILKNKGHARCNHTIYDSFCGLKIEDFSDTITSTVVNGNQIDSPDIGLRADNYYTTGMAITDSQVVLVLSHVGNQITLLHPLDGVASGTEITLARGCQSDKAACIAIGNYDNYLGFPDLPERDIFTGDGLRGDA